MNWLNAVFKIINILTSIFKLGKKEIKNNKINKEIKDKSDVETEKNLNDILNN